MLTTVTRALVLEPHPDDLVIGCAGLLQRLIDQGAEVHSLLLSEVPATYSKIYDDMARIRNMPETSGCER